MAPAATALFFAPQALATDTSGNIYVADTNNHTIRKLTPAGVSTTIAGVAGHAGYSDGASLSQFHSPGGIAVDGGGNIYVADTINSVIRFITVEHQRRSAPCPARPAPTAPPMEPADPAWCASSIFVRNRFGKFHGHHRFTWPTRAITPSANSLPAGPSATLAGIAGTASSLVNGARYRNLWRLPPPLPRSTPLPASRSTTVGNLYVARTLRETMRHPLPRRFIPTSGVTAVIGTPAGTTKWCMPPPERQHRRFQRFRRRQSSPHLPLRAVRRAQRQSLTTNLAPTPAPPAGVVRNRRRHVGATAISVTTGLVSSVRMRPRHLPASERHPLPGRDQCRRPDLDELRPSRSTTMTPAPRPVSPPPPVTSIPPPGRQNSARSRAFPKIPRLTSMSRIPATTSSARWRRAGPRPPTRASTP